MTSTANEKARHQISADTDPTHDLRTMASALPDMVVRSSCNQTSYKAGKKGFLFVGPGAKGIGFKAMFKLATSLHEAEKLAQQEPERFEVGTGSWVTTRFTAEAPLPKKIWHKWLQESYAVATAKKSRKSSRPKR